MNRVNQDVAGRLEEAAGLLQDQGADRYRVGAYLRAASTIRSMQTPVDEVLRNSGLDGLKQLPYVGETIARAIRELVTHGRLPMLDRLRGEADPVTLLGSVPGIGRVLANRLHEELGLETLADLEAAAHDGRLATLAGFGPKARFVDGVWSPDARTNVARFARAPLRARSRMPRAGGELRHMACSPRQAALHEHSEDDAMTPTRGRIESLVMRIQTAFLENPMLSLTLPAAQRRFGMDEVTCAGVLGALVDAQVLTEDDGAYRLHLARPAIRPAA